MPLTRIHQKWSVVVGHVSMYVITYYVHNIRRFLSRDNIEPPINTPTVANSSAVGQGRAEAGVLIRPQAVILRGRPADQASGYLEGNVRAITRHHPGP